MGIFDRAKRIVKSKINSALDNLDIDLGFGDSEDYKSDLSDEEMEDILRTAGYYDAPCAVDLELEKQLKQAYNKLGVLPAMPLSQIEKAFKKEIVKFHPDKFPGDSKKREKATKVSQSLSEAISLIRKHHPIK